MAYRVLSDADAAADATQDAFLSAYRAMSRFRGGSFKAWLLRIVTNACYDQLRTKKRRPAVSLDANEDSDWEEWTEDQGERPEKYVQRQALGDIIQRGLQTLPPDQVPECGPGLEFMLSTLPWNDVVEKVLTGSGECADISWTFLNLSMPWWTLFWFIALSVPLAVFARGRTLSRSYPASVQ